MSSRLLTMKFMQRAAAPSPPSTAQTHDGPPSAKRRKTSVGEDFPIATPSADAQAFQAAADAEDAKRAAAIERVAADAGETKWVLSTADATGRANVGGQRKLRFLAAGYSDIDQEIEQTIGMRGEMGRRSFGRFNRDVEKRQYGGTTSSTPSSSSASSEQEYGNTYSEDEATNSDTDRTESLVQQQTRREEALQRAKAHRKAKKKAEKAEAACLAESRRSKEVKLNKSSSISGGGSGGGVAGIECHFCGQKGHKKADCPKYVKLKRRRGDR